MATLEPPEGVKVPLWRWYSDRVRRAGFDPGWKVRNDLALVVAIIAVVLAFVAYGALGW